MALPEAITISRWPNGGYTVTKADGLPGTLAAFSNASGLLGWLEEQLDVKRPLQWSDVKMNDNRWNITPGAITPGTMTGGSFTPSAGASHRATTGPLPGLDQVNKIARHQRLNPLSSLTRGVKLDPRVYDKPHRETD